MVTFYFHVLHDDRHLHQGLGRNLQMRKRVQLFKCQCGGVSCVDFVMQNGMGDDRKR